MEYLAIDHNFLIVAQSLGAVNFAHLPQACQIGADIRQAFPELIGLESIVQEFITRQQTFFTLSDINRTKAQKSVYFDLHILRQIQSEICLILIQENTERNSLVQQYLQIINQLSLEVEQLTLEKNHYKTLLDQIDNSQEGQRENTPYK